MRLCVCVCLFKMPRMKRGMQECPPTKQQNIRAPLRGLGIRTDPPPPGATEPHISILSAIGAGWNLGPKLMRSPTHHYNQMTDQSPSIRYCAPSLM